MSAGEQQSVTHEPINIEHDKGATMIDKVVILDIDSQSNLTKVNNYSSLLPSIATPISNNKRNLHQTKITTFNTKLNHNYRLANKSPTPNTNTMTNISTIIPSKQHTRDHTTITPPAMSRNKHGEYEVQRVQCYDTSTDLHIDTGHVTNKAQQCQQQGTRPAQINKTTTYNSPHYNQNNIAIQHSSPYIVATTIEKK